MGNRNYQKFPLALSCGFLSLCSLTDFCSSGNIVKVCLYVLNYDDAHRELKPSPFYFLSGRFSDFSGFMYEEIIYI